MGIRNLGPIGAILALVVFGAIGLNMISAGTNSRSNAESTDLAQIKTLCSNDFHTIGGTDDDIPESGDFGNGVDLEADGSLSTDVVSDNEIDYTSVTLNDLLFDVNSVDKTEFGYLDGVTNAIQTQINNVASGSFSIITANSGTISLIEVDQIQTPDGTGTPVAQGVNHQSVIYVAASDSGTEARNSVKPAYLCDGGTDENTINLALSENPGAAIRLIKGTYQTVYSIVVPGSTTLEGEGWGTKIYRGNGSQGATIVNAGSTTGGTTGVVIANLWIDGGHATTTADATPGVVLRKCDYSKVLNVWAQNADNYATHPESPNDDWKRGSGIGIDDSDHVEIAGCVTTGNYHNGIGIRNNCNYIDAHDNISFLNGYEGIVVGIKSFPTYLPNATGEGCSNIALNNNEVHDNGVNGNSAEIYVTDQATSGTGNPMNNIIIANNNVYDSGLGGDNNGILVDRDDATTYTYQSILITGNTIDGVYWNGIRFDYAPGISVTNNIIRNTGYSGITNQSSKDVLVANNKIRNTGSVTSASGINVYGGGTAAATNTTITGNSVANGYGSALELWQYADGCNVTNNTFSQKVYNKRTVYVYGSNNSNLNFSANLVICGTSAASNVGLELANGSGANYCSVSNNTFINTNTAGAPNSKAIDIYTSNNLVENNKIYCNSSSNSWIYGIRLENAATYNVIRGNDLKNGYRTASIYSTGGNTNIITDNRGYNPVGITAIPVGASPYTYSGSVSPMCVIVSGGTVSAIARNGTITGLTSGTFWLEPGTPLQTLVVTYSGVPTMYADIK